MLGIGPTELLLIAGVALVVIAPEKFPDFAKIVMRTIRDVRGYVDEAKRELTEELRPVKDEMRELSRYNPEDYIESMADSVMETPETAEYSDPFDETMYGDGSDDFVDPGFVSDTEAPESDAAVPGDNPDASGEDTKTNGETPA